MIQNLLRSNLEKLNDIPKQLNLLHRSTHSVRILHDAISATMKSENSNNDNNSRSSKCGDNNSCSNNNNNNSNNENNNDNIKKNCNNSDRKQINR